MDASEAGPGPFLKWVEQNAPAARGLAAAALEGPGKQFAERVRALGWGEFAELCALCAWAGPSDAAAEKRLREDAGSREAMAVGAGARALRKRWIEVAQGSERGASQQRAARSLALGLANDFREVALALELHLAILGQTRDAGEGKTALEFLAPLASRLGLEKTKTALEDLGLETGRPEQWQTALKLRSAEAGKLEKLGQALRSDLLRALAKEGVRATVSFRVKHAASAWKKLEKKGFDPRKVFDFLALRAIAESASDCYKALDVSRRLWKEIESEFTDYVASPKKNGYRSIHAVFEKEGLPFELQVRDLEMHKAAQSGQAAHWTYKSGESAGSGLSPAQLGMILDWGGSTGNEQIKNAFSESVWALTPKGRVLCLNPGATALDAAFAVHADVGLRCKGVKVNGKVAPFTAKIATGDVIEALTKPAPAPSRDWMNAKLGYLTSRSALQKLRRWFAAADGDGQGLKEEKPGERKPAARAEPGAAARDGAAGLPAGPEGKGITVGEVSGIKVEMAKCCWPLPPEKISAWIGRAGSAKIHAENCPRLREMENRESRRKVPAQWSASSPGGWALVAMEFSDAKLAAKALEKACAKSGRKAGPMKQRKTAEGCLCEAALKVKDLADLEEALSCLRSMPGCFFARRKRS